MNFESTILTSPDEGINLKGDIRLVKLSLLYSDKIKLVSPKTSTIVAMIQLSNFDKDQQFQLLKELGPLINPNFAPDQLDYLLEQIKSLKRKNRKTRDDLVKIGQFESAFNQMRNGFHKMGQNFYDESDFGQLLPLIENKTLELKHFDIGANKDDISKFMLNEIVEALTQSTSRYPVFDELIGSMAHHYSIENNLVFDRHNPQEIEFGKELIFDLPNIDSISIDDILRIKDELKTELSKFKGAIEDYSKDIESQTFSNESKAEIKKRYESHIKPELNQLREELRRNKFIRILFDQVLSNMSSHVTQISVSLAICSLMDFEKILSVSGVLTETTYKSLKDMRDGDRKIRQSPLFFYNELSKK